jgi:hypothetical protein
MFLLRNGGPGVVGHASNSSSSRVRDRGSGFETSPGKCVRHYLRMQSKSRRGVVQMGRAPAWLPQGLGFKAQYCQKKKMQCDLEKIELSCSQWLMPIILATQEAAIRRFVVQSQQGQIVHETLS